MRCDRILLIGPRGAGKSAAGEALAARRGLSFHDADVEVERATGRSIAALFAAGRFRADEAAALAALLSRREGVVAAGGGAVLWPGLRNAVRGWTVVWLDAAPAERARRIRGDAVARPSLTGRAADDELAAFAVRSLAYDALAVDRVDTTRRTLVEVVDRIEKLLKTGDSADSGNAD